MGQKISALAAASALAGADILPAVQGGTTKKATLTQVLALAMATAMTWTQPQTFNGAVALGSTLAVAGAATLSSTLAVTGLATFTALPRWSALTPGSIPFASTAGQMAQNNAALFWDAANARLGVGNAAPARVLDVTGTFGATGAAVLGSTLAVTGAATLSSTLGVTGVSTFGGTPVTFPNYFFGGRNEVTATTSTRTGLSSGLVANPSGSATATFFAVVGSAETKAGNAQNLTTSTPSLVGVRGHVVHAGSGIVTAAAPLWAGTVTNAGGGTLINVYGLYMQDQTAGTNNYGLYQVGGAVTNYLAGKLSIGVVTPDATAMLDLRSPDTQMALGSVVKTGYLGSNTTVGTHMTWRATAAAGIWTARGTAASVYTQTAALHRWHIDSGLTDGNTFTPTQQMQLSLNSGGGSILTVSTAPSLTSSGSFIIGAQSTLDSTSGFRAGSNVQLIANPATASSASYVGHVGYAATDAACAQNLTGALALRGFMARIRHQGTGTSTGAVGYYVETPTVDNQATGGVITNSYAFYAANQVVTGITNAWAFYSAGAAKSFFGGGLQADAPMQLKSYTLAGLPAAATWPQGQAWCSNHTGGARQVVSDGANWIDVRTGSIAA